MATYWLHTQKEETDLLARVYPTHTMRHDLQDVYYHFSLKTGGRGKDKELHPENRELLTVCSLFTVEELDTLALKGGFHTARDMLYMGTGRPFGYAKRKVAGSNEQQKKKHDLVIKYMRKNAGMEVGSVVEYTTRQVIERKNPDSIDNLQAIALIDWDLNQDVILADAYQDAEEFDYDAMHSMALWFNESRKHHPAPSTQPTATDKVA